MTLLALAPELIKNDEQLEDWDVEGGKASCEAFPESTDEDPDDAPEDPAEDARLALLSAIEAGVVPGSREVRWAWSRVEWLEAAGHSRGTLDELVALGLVVRWETAPDESPPGYWAQYRVPSGACVTLSPLGAELLGVEVRENDVYERPHWVKVVVPTCRRTRLPRWLTYRARGLEMPEAIVDPAPGPLEDLLMAEVWDHAVGAPETDPITGMPLLVPLLLFGRTVPVVRPKGKVSKKKVKTRRKGTKVR